jgi:hypothetical protein
MPCGRVHFTLRRSFAAFVFLGCAWMIRDFVTDGYNPMRVLGLALLELRARVEGDPHGVFDDWDPMGNNPCSWSGVQCSDGKVEIL